MYWKFIVIIVIFSLPLLSLFTPGLPVTHDGQDHVARIANFYQSLSEGNIVPRWAGNLNWGYGHPILMFLYPLPSYMTSVVHFFGFSFVNSTKLVFALSYITSLLAIYWWISRWIGKSSGVISAILYGFAPYRFVDLYVRGALGEHVAFIFAPLICLGLWMVAKNSKHQSLWSLVASFSVAGLLLSHNAVSLMLLPLVIFYLIYLFFFETKQSVKFLIFSLWLVSLGFLMTAFFWMPAFWEGKYTLRDIVTKGNLSGRFVPWTWFFYSPWNYGGEFGKEIGPVHWVVILGAILLLPFKKVEKKIKYLLFGLLISFLLSIFLMTEWSQIVWEKVTLLQKFQFPWRFLTVSIFSSSIVGGIVVSKLPKRLIQLAFLFVLFVTIFYTLPMWKPKAYLVKPETFYTGIYESTTDTGESSPIWSVRFMEHRPKALLEVIEGNAQIMVKTRTTTKHVYTISSTSKVRLAENTLYFPGWNVLVDGKLTPVEFQDPMYRGLMTFWIEKGSHGIEVVFGETKLRMLANRISVAGLVILVSSITIQIWLKKK